jgi:hypothetical protein
MSCPNRVVFRSKWSAFSKNSSAKSHFAATLASTTIAAASNRGFGGAVFSCFLDYFDRGRKTAAASLAEQSLIEVFYSSDNGL